MDVLRKCGGEEARDERKKLLIAKTSLVSLIGWENSKKSLKKRDIRIAPGVLQKRREISGR